MPVIRPVPSSSVYWYIFFIPPGELDLKRGESLGASQSVFVERLGRPKTVDEEAERNGRISPVCSNGGLKVYAKETNSDELEVTGTKILDLTKSCTVRSRQ
jgi:hypothetical protein